MVDNLETLRIVVAVLATRCPCVLGGLCLCRHSDELGRFEVDFVCVLNLARKEVGDEDRASRHSMDTLGASVTLSLRVCKSLSLSNSLGVSISLGLSACVL